MANQIKIPIEWLAPLSNEDYRHSTRIRRRCNTCGVLFSVRKKGAKLCSKCHLKILKVLPIEKGNLK